MVVFLIYHVIVMAIYLGSSKLPGEDFEWFFATPQYEVETKGEEGYHENYEDDRGEDGGVLLIGYGDDHGEDGGVQLIGYDDEHGEDDEGGEDGGVHLIGYDDDHREDGAGQLIGYDGDIDENEGGNDNFDSEEEGDTCPYNCYDLEKRCEEFIAMVTKKWREELFSEAKLLCMATDES